MRVLIVLNWLGRGGIEVMLLRSLKQLQKEGVRLDFCCLGGPNVLDVQFRDLGCRIAHFRRRLRFDRGRKEVASLLAARRYDLVHSQFGFTSGGIVRAAAAANVPSVVSIHRPCGPAPRIERVPVLRRLRSEWLNWHRRETLRHASMIIGHSEANLDAAHPDWRSHSGRFRVVLNGVAPPASPLPKRTARAALRLPQDAFLLLHVGSFVPSKNHIGVLKIFGRVAARLPNAWLALVGDGPRRGQVERHASREPFADQVRFFGSRDDVGTFYSAADVLLFPSHFEGFGNVLAEAQASRLPVVASRIPAHLESLAPAQHAFLFAPHDYAAASRLVIQQLLAASRRANPWVEASVKLVRQRFSIERFSADLASSYRAVIGADSRLFAGPGPSPSADQPQRMSGKAA